MCVIYQTEATWRTCVKSSSVCEASRIKLQCYNQSRCVRRIQETWKRPKGLAYSDGISVNSGVDRPRRRLLEFSPRARLALLSIGGCENWGSTRGKKWLPYTVRIRQLGHFITSLHRLHWGWMVTENWRRREQKGEWWHRVRTGSRKQYHTYRRRGRS